MKSPRVCSCHDIHVLHKQLTAYRILENSRDVGAPRRDPCFRWQIEYSQILQHYRAMSAGSLGGICRGLAARGISCDGPHDLWLAELALTVGSPSHQLWRWSIIRNCARRPPYAPAAGTVW